VHFQQAIIQRESDGQLAFGKSSLEFNSEWLAPALAMCEAFSADPPNFELPESLFVQRLDKRHVAIVRTLPSKKAGAAPLRFHLLVAAKPDYAAMHGDPFEIAGQFTPDWSATSDLPILEWPGTPVPRRTVADVQRVLKRPNGPELLGGCQALLDGSRLLFSRAGADADVIRSIWMLLPYSNRLELLPATFAWNASLKFDVVVAPAERADQFTNYLTEEQAGGYPEGRFELSLQTAAEADDQESLDILWSRRSRREVWRTGILLVIVMGILALAIQLLSPAKKH
jgi:hypothetical protein